MSHPFSDLANITSFSKRDFADVIKSIISRKDDYPRLSG
jgi:hypothetical protein